MTPRKLKIGLYYPTYAGNGGCSSLNPLVAQWHQETIQKIKADPRCESLVEYKFEADTPITMTRNSFVLEARKAGVDVLVMVDSDQDPLLAEHAGDPTIKPFWDSSFDFLYQHYDKGPVCIFAPYGGPPPYENVYVFQFRNEQYLGDEHTLPKLDQYTREEALMMAGIQAVAAGPTGLIMVDMRCFDLIEPSGRTRREVLEDLATGQITVEQAEFQLHEGWFYYEWENSYAAHKDSTEDVTFTRDLAMVGSQRLGYNPVFCNWDAWIGHVKPWTVGKPRRITVEAVGAQFRRACSIDGRERHVEFRNNALIERLSRGQSKPRGVVVQPESVEIGGPPKTAQWVRSEGVWDYEKHAATLKSFMEHGNGHVQSGDPPVKVGATTAGGEVYLRADENGQPHFDRYYWSLWDKVADYLDVLATEILERDECAVILDIGPGTHPWVHANRFAGRNPEGYSYPGPFYELDLNCDPLPFDAKSVDFIYCRHVLEDLDNPEHLLKEIRRVARAGYIETPSPIAECCRGVDSPTSLAPGRGYAHHKWLVGLSRWGKLCFLPKYQALDSLPLDDNDLRALLRSGPELWNTHCLFGEGADLAWLFLKHEQDFLIGRDERYEALVNEMLEDAEAAGNRWADRLGLTTQGTR
jgi:SAM-dependent methyltransferase